MTKKIIDLGTLPSNANVKKKAFMTSLNYRPLLIKDNKGDITGYDASKSVVKVTYVVVSYNIEPDTSLTYLGSSKEKHFIVNDTIKVQDTDSSTGEKLYLDSSIDTVLKESELPVDYDPEVISPIMMGEFSYYEKHIGEPAVYPVFEQAIIKNESL